MSSIIGPDVLKLFSDCANVQKTIGGLDFWGVPLILTYFYAFIGFYKRNVSISCGFEPGKPVPNTLMKELIHSDLEMTFTHRESFPTFIHRPGNQKKNHLNRTLR